MKVLIVDLEAEATALDLALRAKRADHDVRYWLPPHAGTGRQLPYGQGLLPIVTDWESSADWADLIIVNGNSRSHSDIADYMGRGYPMFATNERAAQLELDRALGQRVLEEHGVATLPYVVVDSIDAAIEHIARTDEAYAIKTWGADSDKANSIVAASPEDAVVVLQKWKQNGKGKGQLMLQQKAEGVEIGIAGWFGPGGWAQALEESFEHKKFLNDDLGQSTGEQGTVIRHVTESKLFEKVLEPLTDYLQGIGYVGDASINCIIDEKGAPWPLEWTCRFGVPDLHIRYALLQVDPITWMLELLQGKDGYIVSPKVAVGVVMSHGDYPILKDPLGTWDGYPIRGITADNEDSLHMVMVRKGKYPIVVDGAVKERSGLVTSGSYVMVATGTGATVQAAQRAAYKVADAVRWPSNVMYRTDIGERLKSELPLLQLHGYAVGMEY